MKRSFASLSAQEALHVAIFIEERNAEIYRQFADMFAEFRDPESLEIAAAFWDLFNEERKHGTLLQQRYSERYANSSCAVTEEDISDLIEVPRLENGEIFTVDKLKSGRSPRQMAFSVALAAERSAEQFYRSVAESTADDGLRAICLELSEMEASHSNWLEQRAQVANAHLQDNQAS